MAPFVFRFLHLMMLFILLVIAGIKAAEIAESVTNVTQPLVYIEYRSQRYELHDIQTWGGTNVSISCRAENRSGNVQVYWLKEGKVLTQSDFYVITNGTLMLVNATRKQAGHYSCAGKLKEDITLKNITLYFEGTYFEEHLPRSTTALEGTNLTLECKVYSIDIKQSTEELRPAWYWNNYLIKPKHQSCDKVSRVERGCVSILRHSVPDDDVTVTSLVLGPLSLADTGYYLCKAGGEQHQIETGTYLRVKEGIVFANRLQTAVHVMIGGHAVLDCRVLNLHDHVNITWLFNGRAIPEHGKHAHVPLHGKGMLYLADITPAQLGEYTCTASTAVQTRIQTTHLKATGALPARRARGPRARGLIHQLSAGFWVMLVVASLLSVLSGMLGTLWCMYRRDVRQGQGSWGRGYGPGHGGIRGQAASSGDTDYVRARTDNADDDVSMAETSLSWAFVNPAFQAEPDDDVTGGHDVCNAGAGAGDVGTKGDRTPTTPTRLPPDWGSMGEGQDHVSGHVGGHMVLSRSRDELIPNEESPEDY